MKFFVFASLFAGHALQIHALQTGPVAKAIQLLTDLQAKVTSEGEKAQQVYEDFSEWCEDESQKLTRSIKTAKQEVVDLTATIDEENALISSLSAKIEELSGRISRAEKDLKSAKEVRSQEAKDYTDERDELSDTIDALDRAISVLERHLGRGSAALVQVPGAQVLEQALAAIVDSSGINTADVRTLAALIQTTQLDAANEGVHDSDVILDPGPSTTTKSPEEQGSTIIKTLESLLEKAQIQLQEAHRKEETALRDFVVLEATLTDKVKYSTRDMNDAKKRTSTSKEKLAEAEGAMARVSKDLKGDTAAKKELHSDCLQKAAEFDTATKERTEELRALAQAKKALQTAGASESLMQRPLSLVQLVQTDDTSALLQEESFANGVADSHSSQVRLFAALRTVRDSARAHHSAPLVQLASRMAALADDSVEHNADPFAKVRGLISNMIKRLEDAASAEAKQKTYCDNELAATRAKKEERSTDVEELNTRIDKLTSTSAKLRESTHRLRRELAELAKSLLTMDKIRKLESNNFVKDKAEIEKGVEGVKIALRVLRDFYGESEDKKSSSTASGASSIIGMLEVVESDFCSHLAQLITDEDQAQEAYDKETKDIEVEKAAKEEDLKFGVKRLAQIEKATAEDQNDLASVQAELDSVLEYLKRIESVCIAKPEPYEERVKKREAEISSLKEALQILRADDALLQNSFEGRSLRGAASRL